MKTGIHIWCCSALLLATVARADDKPPQVTLLVDNGGPRNLLNGQDELLGFKGKLDTGNKSVQGTFLQYCGGGPDAKDAPALRPTAAGAGVTLSAPGDLGDLLKGKVWPKVEVSGLANWSWISGPMKGFASLTTRLAFSYEQDAVLDPAVDTKVKKPGIAGYTLSLTYSRLWQNRHAFAVSAGIGHSNNYADLPQQQVGTVQNQAGGLVTLADAQSAGIGRIHQYTIVPLSVLYSYTWETDWLDERRVFWNCDPKVKVTFIPMIAPYLTVTPRTHGSPPDAAGLNVTVKMKTWKEGELRSMTKVSYPIAVFVERRNVLVGHGESWKFGAAAIYSFP